MAMEINGNLLDLSVNQQNYGNYYAGMAADSKKESGRVSEGTKNVKGSSKDNVQEYYEKLCKKFPQMGINTIKGIVTSSKNNIVLNLSSDCLKKMASDPDYAKKIENDIAGIPAAHEQMFAKAKSDGIEIHGFAVRINADGSMQCSCSGSTRSSDTKQSSTISNIEKKQKERLEKKRKERKVLEERMQEERAAKRRAEKEHANNRIAEERIAEEGTGEVRISVTGNSVEGVTKSVMSAISANTRAGVAGFDVKA